MKQKHTLFNKQERALASFCKSLGHPARIRIIKHLMSNEDSLCKDIVKKLPMAQSTVSQHLAELRRTNLIVGKPDGVKMKYSFNRDIFAKDAKDLLNEFSS